MPSRPQRDEERLALQRFTGRRIREAREAIKVTQRELARRLGYSHTWLANIELGSNSIDAHDLKRIAKETGYPCDWFVDPKFEPVSLRRPRSTVEWEAMYPDRPEIAQAHFGIDRAFRMSFAG